MIKKSIHGVKSKQKKFKKHCKDLFFVPTPVCFATPVTEHQQGGTTLKDPVFIENMIKFTVNFTKICETKSKIYKKLIDIICKFDVEFIQKKYIKIPNVILQR